MPRPSKKEQRKTEILEAFERCVARFGVEGATLEKVAEEAGLARALIRHNVGNREDLLTALVERFIARSNAEVTEMLAQLPRREKMTTLIGWLFDPRYSDPQSILVADALNTAAAQDPALAKIMRDWIAGFVRVMEDLVASDYPDAAQEDRAAVAAGVTAMYFTMDSLSTLGGLVEMRHSTERAARRLLRGLEGSRALLG